MSNDELIEAFWAWARTAYVDGMHRHASHDTAFAAWMACAAVVRAHDRDSGLQRYGIEWTGPHTPICVEKADGYWTPWHVAQAELAALRIENDTLRAELESAHAAQRHAEKELSQYVAWYAMAEHQHLHEQRRAEKAEAERDALRAAVEEIEERTRPNGDMADLAVNLVARSTLGGIR